ncbi:MAG TPA: hypothetical protein VHG09_08335 [Longimicrobiales bacterium]|nr:hypothetical protein [Longimicrobiales bacterium]
MADSTDTPRVSPYDLIFGPAVFDQTRFEAVREQTDAHHAASPEQLFMLPAAGELLRELAPPEGGRDTVAQVRALLFSAYQYWRHGRHTYCITEPLLEQITAPDADLSTSPLPPSEAGYVQLPRNAVWARVADDAPPEPVDGFFWSAPRADDAGTAERLDLLFALGLRPGRPGLSLFDVSLDAAAQLTEWAKVDARPDGEDFANILPGGELQGYRAVTTGAEALKLAARSFARVADRGLRWSVVEQDGETVHNPADG